MSVGAAALLAALAGAAAGPARHGGRALMLRAHAVNESTPLGKQPAAALSPLQFMKLGEECKCAFVERCTCGAAVAYLDCVSSACASGSCSCPPDQSALTPAMGDVCPSLGISFSADHVECSKRSDYPFLKTPKRPSAGQEGCRHPEACSDLLEELEALRAKKCMLIEAGKDGWLNADERLGETYEMIWERTKKLEAIGGTAPDMSCPVPQSMAALKTAQPEVSWNKTHTEETVTPRPAQRVRTSVIPGFFVALTVPHEYYLALLFTGFMVLVFATLYSWHTHTQLREQGQGPYCGVFSTLCCIFCTPATLCWPIDAAKP